MIKEVSLNELELFTDNAVSAISNEFRRAIGYYFGDVLVGYLIYDLIYERIEIVDIFVVDEMRNRKIGTNMIKYLIDLARSSNCSNITLEVRKSNCYAIMLYESNGFLRKAIRKGYYNGEDGILMELIL